MLAALGTLDPSTAIAAAHDFSLVTTEMEGGKNYFEIVNALLPAQPSVAFATTRSHDPFATKFSHSNFVGATKAQLAC